MNPVQLLSSDNQAPIDTPERGARRLATYRRARARADERGSTLFIVVMVITLMTAVGLYSMRAASLAEQAVGFNRLGVQTTYVTEFAARSVMAEMVGKEQHYYQFISRASDDCRATSELAAILDPERPTCYKLLSEEIWNRTNEAFPGNFGSAATPTLFGEMSRANSKGAFVVELTDLARAGNPIAGEDVAADHFKYMQVVVTATGQVRPAGDPEEDDGTCNEAFSTTSGLQTLRAQITFGPVN